MAEENEFDIRGPLEDQVETPTLDTEEKVTAKEIEEDPLEIISKPTQLGDVSVTADQTPDTTDVKVPVAGDAETYTAVTSKMPKDLTAAAGQLSEQALIDIADVQGQVSAESLVQAAQGEVSPEATVQYQMSQLMSSIEEGQPLPAWAAPAARAVGSIMAQRGLGSSSMASAAITQAVLESGIPIAQQDAATYAQIDLTNLNNQQQAALQNAATYATMDKANLDARLQAAVSNAQSFLAIDLQNLTNDQKTREVNYQAKVQQAFTNQAAQNASRQFNATSQNQIDMFFAELGTQVATANANRSAAAEQFNVSQKNAMKQFVESTNNQRDQFNQNLRLQIDQSNAQWRRSVNTANTAAENAARQQNVQNAFAKSQNATNNLWQAYRDELAWANTSAENEEARSHEITLYALQQSAALEILDAEVEGDIWKKIGKRIVDKVIPA